MNMIDELKDKYNKVSKHSGYQILPMALKNLICDNEIKVDSRSERERLDYIQTKIDLSHKKIADIGGNTGFFSFECISGGAEEVFYFEGNEEHASFVSLASQAVEYSDRIKVFNKYFDFSNDREQCFDVMFVLNVLHHVGDDYGDKNLSIDMAKKEIIHSLKNISKQTKILIFQIGYNWMGDISRPLFQNGTKMEQIDFLVNNLSDYYEFVGVGIAEKKNNCVQYVDKNMHNVERIDGYGEFLNRPLFILKSKKNTLQD